MTGAKDLLLLLLAAHVLLGGCQSNTVSMYPNLPQIYSGDLFYLDCESNVGEVKWFHNDIALPSGDNILRIPVAASKHSGTYRCETNSDKKRIYINVLDYHPTAFLSLLTGQPVMQKSNSVILRLHNEEGLQGWRCSVQRAKESKRISLRMKDKSVNFLDFQPVRLEHPETIFMCTNSNGSQRSNQVTIRTTDKDISLEIYFAPGIIGDAMTLSCYSWNNDKFSRVVFYKNDQVLADSTSLTHRIGSVKEADQGTYKCDATIDTSQHRSDAQELFVQEAAVRAVVSGIFGLSCSCPRCNSGINYIWFKITEGSRPERLPERNQGLDPEESGTYACMAVWRSGRSLISKSHFYNPTIIILGIIFAVIVCFVGVMTALVVTFKKKQRRSHTGAVYEDVRLQSQEDRYERLQKRGGQKETEYDTIHPAEPEGVRKEGDYQTLAQAEIAKQVYHTLEVKEGECSAAPGGYEALHRQPTKEDIYHTIGMPGAAGEGQQ